MTKEEEYLKNPWYYKGEPVLDVDDEYYGFVYIISDVLAQKHYIGRKFLTKAGYKVVKGKKKKVRKPSTWRDYWGSSKELLIDIQTHGKESFRRTIIRFCKTRSECSYYESKEIFTRDALIRNDFYNSWCSCRIQSDHLKHLQKDVDIFSGK